MKSFTFFAWGLIWAATLRICCEQQALEAEEKGLAGEAVRGNGTKNLILRVDASKLAYHPMINATIGGRRSEQNLNQTSFHSSQF